MAQASTNNNEPLTNELLERLLASATPEAYLSGNETFDRTLSDYLTQLLDEKQLKKSEVIRASAVNSTYAYQLFSGDRDTPSRDVAIKLAFGLRCSLVEAQRLLRYAGVAELWCKLRRDAIIIHCLSTGMTREQCDDELYRMGEPTLVSEE